MTHLMMSSILSVFLFSDFRLGYRTYRKSAIMLPANKSRDSIRDKLNCDDGLLP